MNDQSRKNAELIEELSVLKQRIQELEHSDSDRKRAEERLRESEEYFKEITENASDIIIITDKNGDIKYCSPSIERFAGYKAEDLIGKSGFTFVHPDDVKRAVDDFGKAILAIDSAIPNAFRIVHKDGSERYFEGLGKNLLHNPAVAGFIMNIRDITDRKRVEEEKRSLEEHLQRAEKMEALGQLAGGVAHDLNNVLGVLSGYSELLLEEIPEGHQSRGHAEMILQSTEKGAAIIQDLLTLARRGVTASDVINLNSVVFDFLKTPIFDKLQAYHPYVTFRKKCDKNLLNIKGSLVHLEKTLMNLVSNAAESISGKGEVTIRTESRYLDKAIGGYDELKEGDYAVLTVSDTGTGIPIENREKIFEPFYTKKTMGRSGTGLGLAIVWGTVKDHKGYIDLQTEVGQGTTFTLYFPVTREEMIAPQQKEPIDRYMGNGESVLVVDDIAEQRDIASRLLTRLGYQVSVVSSGEEGVEYLKENKADILVLDMIMTPGIDGLETYQRVLEINPKQKAILVSGFSETERVKEAQKLGAGAYVKKPYVMEKIGVAIRDELNR
jgi:PAS domain S-box-containing protein